jgi:hypothetical protein
MDPKARKEKTMKKLLKKRVSKGMRAEDSN